MDRVHVIKPCLRLLLTDRRAWWAAVHEVTKSQTRLSGFTFMHWRRKWQPTPVFLPGESQRWGSLVGCRGLKQLSSSSSSSRRGLTSNLKKSCFVVFHFSTIILKFSKMTHCLSSSFHMFFYFCQTFIFI